MESSFNKSFDAQYNKFGTTLESGRFSKKKTEQQQTSNSIISENNEPRRNSKLFELMRKVNPGLTQKLDIMKKSHKNDSYSKKDKNSNSGKKKKEKMTEENSVLKKQTTFDE